MNKRVVFAILSFSLLIGVFVYAAEESKEAPGKTLFLANKCDTCHSMAAENIKQKVKPTGKKVPPDLSNIGEKRTAEWLMKYLKRTETVNNEKHPKPWSGKEEDLNVLAKWLEEHKKMPETK
jgi:cbb3-type cytochrome oxidase cytochrome c subunit